MLIFQWQVSELGGNCHCCHYHSGASQEEHVREASRLLIRPACSLRAFKHKSHCLICPPGTQRTRALVCTCSPCHWSQGSTFHFGGEKLFLLSLIVTLIIKWLLQLHDVSLQSDIGNRHTKAHTSMSMHGFWKLHTKSFKNKLSWEKM